MACCAPCTGRAGVSEPACTRERPRSATEAVFSKKATMLDVAPSNDSFVDSVASAATCSTASSEHAGPAELKNKKPAASAAQRWRQAGFAVRFTTKKEKRDDARKNSGSLFRMLTRRASRIPTTTTSERDQIQQLRELLMPGGPLADLSDFAKAYGDEAFCRRLLRKYDGNFSKARDKLKQSLQWRQQHEQLLRTKKFVHGGDYRVIGADLSERPVLYMCMKNQLLSLGQCLDQQIVATLQAIENMPPGVEKATHVWDLHGMMVRLNWNPAPLVQIMQTAEGYFAERMQELVIIDMPRVAAFLKDAVWPLLPEKTKQKVRFLSAKEAKAHFDSALDAATAARILACMEQNRDVKVSLEERRKTWVRVNECGHVVPAFD